MNPAPSLTPSPALDREALEKLRELAGKDPKALDLDAYWKAVEAFNSPPAGATTKLEAAILAYLAALPEVPYCENCKR